MSGVEFCGDEPRGVTLCGDEPCGVELFGDEPCGDEPCGDEPYGVEFCVNEPCGDEPCGDELCGVELCGDGLSGVALSAEHLKLAASTGALDPPQDAPTAFGAAPASSESWLRGLLRDGFETANADAIFESTFRAQREAGLGAS